MVAQPVQAEQVIVNPFVALSSGERSLVAKVCARVIALDRDLDVNDINHVVKRAAEIFIRARSFNTKVGFFIDLGISLRRYGSLTDRQALAVVRNIHKDADLREILDPEREEDVFVVEFPVPATQVMAIQTQAPTIKDGYFTVVLDDGSHVTLRILTRQRRNGQGSYRRLAYLNGPSNTTDYLNIGTIEGSEFRPFADYEYGYERQKLAAKYLLSGQQDEEECGVRYATESTHCYRCNQMLTNPLSIELGIGPECRRKGL